MGWLVDGKPRLFGLLVLLDEAIDGLSDLAADPTPHSWDESRIPVIEHAIVDFMVAVQGLRDGVRVATTIRGEAPDGS